MKNNIHNSIALIVCTVMLLAFENVERTEGAANRQVHPFKEMVKDFPREEKNLRKWDAPVVADLDQDGHLDLLLNDHGFGVRVCWNNNGRYTRPHDIIMGDLHGITVGDFDLDGDLEIVMSRGGGAGSNARNSKLFRVDRERNFTELPDFDVPLDLMRGRTVKLVDGDNDGDLDLLNFAFPDKEKMGESENYVYENDGAGQLVLFSKLPSIKANGQKTLVTDFNNDGVVDILLFGHEKVRVFQGSGDLTYEEVTKKIFPTNFSEVTSMLEIDYDNDGDFDLFLTRGKEFEKGETFYDSDSQVWGFFTKRGDFQFEDLVVGDILNIENFQSQWPDNDAFYIGETGYTYEFEGETHSGKNMRLVNSDALGFPDKFHEDRGTYIGYVGNRAWRIAGNLWAPATGVVHGVESYLEFEHPKGLADVLLENKNGKFVQAYNKNSPFLEEHTMGSASADFDNNGYSDILVVRRGDLIHENESLIFFNQGGSNFVQLDNPNIVSTELGAIGMCVETLDYNQDGRIDVVVGNERGKWHLFKNQLKRSENENYLVVEVGNSPSNQATALGAIVTVATCGNQQVKRVGSTGAVYSLSFNPFIHFGLGICNEPATVKVVWSNGETAETSTNDLKVLVGRK